MRILFISDNFPPETNAPASRTWEHLKVWVEEGHEVTVITGAPNFPRGRVFEGYRNRLYQTEEMDGIRVVRVWTYIAANKGFAKRILDYLSFMASALLALPRQKRPDIIVGTSPQFFTAVAACVAGFLRRRPWVFELRDLWPESIKAVGAMKEGRLLRALERLEYFLYRRAAAVVSVTESFRETLVEGGIDRGKIHVVRNGVELDSFTPRDGAPELRRELGLAGDEFVVSFIGTLGMAHGLESLLEAARLLEGERLRLILVGEGARKEALREKADEMGLDNVLFVPGQPRSRMPEFLAASDACLVHLRRTPLFRTVIPSKIFEAMAMARPIVMGVEGESADLIEEAGAGLCVEPENSGALAAAVRRLMGDPGLAAELGRKGREAAETRYDRRVAARAMLKILEDIVEKRA